MTMQPAPGSPGPVPIGAPGRRELRVGCDLGYSASLPIPAVVQVFPRMDTGIATLDDVVLREVSWSVTGDQEPVDYHDVFGNRCRRIVLPAGESRVSFRAIASVPDVVDEADPTVGEAGPADLPADVLQYTLPSRYCESDRLAHVAWKLFGDKGSGYERLAAICSWTWHYLTYSPGATDASTSAAECYRSARGVCRDYAHLMIAICRGLNIPARYAAGYLPDMDVPPLPSPMDFHAWVEVWLGERWWVFDPRHDARRKGRVKIGHGRDAADLPSLTFFGAPILRLFDIHAHEVDAAGA